MINIQPTKFLLVFPHPKEIGIDRPFERDILSVNLLVVGRRAAAEIYPPRSLGIPHFSKYGTYDRVIQQLVWVDW
jgi:hypothetical protein